MSAAASLFSPPPSCAASADFSPPLPSPPLLSPSACAQAQSLNGEVVSADSVQLYRQLSVGSNKLPLDSRGGVAHHLLDCAELSHDLTVADWYELAVQTIGEIVGRGRLPIICGGTGLYIRWLLYGQPLSVGTTKDSRERAERLVHDDTAWEDK